MTLKTIRRVLPVIIAAALLLSLCACAGRKKAPEAAQEAAEAQAAQTTETETKNDAAQAETQSAGAETPVKAPDEAKPAEEASEAPEPPADAEIHEITGTEETPAAEPVSPAEPQPEAPTEPKPAEEAPAEGERSDTGMPEIEITDAPTEEQKPAQEAPAPAAEPYSEKTAATVLTVTGLEREWYFTLAELQSLGGQFSGDYFSRGKEPQEATTSFTGIKVQYLLESVIGLSAYKKAKFTASDGYAASFSRAAVNASYINEKAPGSSLPMILAWTEDGAPCALHLAMGQQIEGEYNRTNWVRDVITIEIRVS